MCVAVIIASKKRVPLEHLLAMEEANPHGGGIAWYSGGQVMFRKGMTAAEIDKIQDKLPRPFLLHFRIATKGAKIPELTHPFPIGMQAFTEDLTGVAEKGVIIHNGTWSNFFRYVPNGIDVSKVSDTQVAAYVSAFDESVLDEVRWSNVIMTPDKLVYRGQWTEENGNYYSNMHWKRELDWSSYLKNYNQARTTTHRQIPEPRKKSHQGNRSQVNGRTVTNQGQYQTQFSKSGKGVHTVQSNGKTMKENREAKQAARKPDNDNYYASDTRDPYDRALGSYRQSLSTGSRGGSWSGNDRLFEKDEIPGYHWNSEGVLTRGPKPEIKTSLGLARTTTAEVGKFLGPSVKCPDCHEEIVTIPCQCGMNSEAKLEAALDEELERFVNEVDDEGNYCSVEVSVGGIEELEDMNAYGQSAGLDGMGSGEMDDIFINPDFAEAQRVIQADKVTMKGESTDDPYSWEGVWVD